MSVGLLIQTFVRDTASWVKDAIDLAFSMPAKDGKETYDYHHWQKFFDLPSYKENFLPREDSMVRYTSTGTIELVTERMKTWSPVAVLSEGKKMEFTSEIERIVKKGEDVVWVDEKEGTFEIPFAVPIILVRRKVVE